MPRPVVFSMQANIRGFQRGITRAAAVLGRLDTRARRANRSLSRLGKASQSASSGLGGVVGAAGAAGAAVTGLVQGFLAVGAVGASAFAAVENAVESTIGAFAEFEARQAIISALFGTTGSAADALQTSVTRIGIASTFSVKEVQGLFRELGQLGTRVKDVDAVGQAVIELAEVTGSEPVIAAKLLQGQLNAFNRTGEDARRTMVALAQAANNSGARMEDLAVSLQFVGPAAAAVGGQLEDVIPAIEALRSRSIEASVAGTSLRSFFTQLVKPTKEGQRALDAFGLSAAEVDPRTRSLIEIIGSLETATNKMTGEAFGLEQALAIFGRRAAANIFTLTQFEARGKKGAAALRALKKELQDEASVERRLAQIRGTLLATFKRLTATVLQTGVVIGDLVSDMLGLVGISESLTRKLTDVFSLFDKLRSVDRQKLQEITVKLFDPDKIGQALTGAVTKLVGPVTQLFIDAFEVGARAMAPPLFGAAAGMAVVFSKATADALAIAAADMASIFRENVIVAFLTMAQKLAEVGRSITEAANGLITAAFKLNPLPGGPALPPLISLKPFDTVVDGMKKLIAETKRESQTARQTNALAIRAFTDAQTKGLVEAAVRAASQLPRAIPGLGLDPSAGRRLGESAGKTREALSSLFDDSADQFARMAEAFIAGDTLRKAEAAATAKAFENFRRFETVALFNTLGTSPAGPTPMQLAEGIQARQAGRLAQVQTRQVASIETLNESIQRLIRAFQQRNQQAQEFGPLPQPAPAGSVRRISVGVINNYRSGSQAERGTLKGAGGRFAGRGGGRSLNPRTR